MPISASSGTIFKKTSPVTKASSSAVWRPTMMTPRRSAIAPVGAILIRVQNGRQQQRIEHR